MPQAAGDDLGHDKWGQRYFLLLLRPTLAPGRRYNTANAHQRPRGLPLFGS